MPSSRVGDLEYGISVRPAAMSGLRETDGAPVRPHLGEKDLSTRTRPSKVGCPLSQRLQARDHGSLWRRKRVRSKVNVDQVGRVSKETRSADIRGWRPRGRGGGSVMKRRSFLGMAVGAAAAAPAMAREAVQTASTAARTPVNGGLGMLSGGLGIAAGDSPDEYDPRSEAQRMLSKLVGKTAAQVAAEKQRIFVDRLDGDIAGMKSLSWHAKVRMQRDRDYEWAQRSERSRLENFLNGITETMWG